MPASPRERQAGHSVITRQVLTQEVCEIEEIIVDGIDCNDFPDFCDAYIDSALVSGRPATEWELDRMNEDSELVHSAVEEFLY